MTDHDSQSQHQPQAAGAEISVGDGWQHGGRPFWSDLAGFGAQEALISSDKRLTYAGLAVEIAAHLGELRTLLPAGVTRPLVALEMRRDVASVVNYLAMLNAGWPVILLEPGVAQSKARGLIEQYAPNLILGADGPVVVKETPCAMHDDLRLLLSTSGTTGAAKLVRLSDQNISSNAAAISRYLGLSGSERAITTLPLHYSYGLSVLHAHLAVGAPVILTEQSVTTSDFWDMARANEASSLALVPAQADALAPDQLSERLPSLRYVTQAGGRLDPAAARQFAAQKWQFYIMYGQTEAAPRMAYLPPGTEIDAPGLIGRAIPGGALSLHDTEGQLITGSGKVGELIYRGPNVMMGYAETRSDLARGAELNALETGDLAERRQDGLYRIVGRKARFIKPFGLRIGLDEVETRVQGSTGPAYAVGTDDYLAVFVKTLPDGLAKQMAEEYCLPATAVMVIESAEIPQLPSGKPDYKKLSELAAKHRQLAASDGLEGIVASALRLGSVDMAQSFRSLGGDSLAYLQVQLWLSSRRAVLDGWDERPLQELQTLPKTTRLELPADQALRVLAICTVIALHATDLSISGGTYILLILAGYSLARFQMDMLVQGRIGHVLRTMLLPILLGYYLIIGGAHLFRAPVPAEWFLLIANLDPAAMTQRLQPYWFVNTYAQVIAFVSLAFALPPMRKRIAAEPFLSGLIALGGIVLAFEGIALNDVTQGLRQRHPVAALELLVIGWCVFFARAHWQKWLICVAVTAIFARHWSDVPPSGAGFLLVGAVLLILRAKLRVPAWLYCGVTIIGGATMLIYLLHPILISVVFALELSSGARFALVAIGSAGLALALQAGAQKIMGRWRAGFGGTRAVRVKHWLNGAGRRY